MSPASSACQSPLSASIVLYHSDCEVLEKALVALDLAVAQLALDRVIEVAVVDQSMDSDYFRRISDVLGDDARWPHLAVLLIETTQNKGYGGGQNLGIARTHGDVHLILNPDVELATNALTEGLTCLANDAKCALVAPRSVLPTGQEEYLAKSYPSVLVLALRAFAPRWLRQRFAERLARYELHHLSTQGEPQPVTLASGCCMLVRREALTDVSGFDERYFLYFEDYDLSMRLAARGRLYRVPGMLIVHHGGNAAAKGWRHIRWFVAGGIRFFNQYGWRWF
ncbi:glycosyl transferase, family 2 [Luminiphilus syltensis NOR5-1B]|uniref:Glycosyl transferase, family 2 n=1 Tax=Luminiphilus syltensis NOR5-1B TaxID=565045 RepID=B8KQE3_9GAMM|nr:glycosyltransferase family 2 protein [Luminiphilus syltensis]EED35625.1 glycosyl transferase, family 2 [Luminiphilus syltensis NOR5-1B]